MLSILMIFLQLQSPLAKAAEDTVRLGNFKLAHFAAISYIKELKDCGIKVEERTFAKGPDVMQGILAGGPKRGNAGL